MTLYQTRSLATVVGAALLTTACGAPDIHLNSLTTLNAEVRGAALSPTGDVVQVAMLDTTCAFNSYTGLLLDDVNLPGDNDQIVDAGRGTFLGMSDGQLHEIDGSIDVHDVPGVVDGLVTDDGLIALSNDDFGCNVTWLESGNRTELPEAACTGTLVGPRDGSVVAVTGEGGAWIADQEGIVADLGLTVHDAVWLKEPSLLVVASEDGLLGIDDGGVVERTFDVRTRDVSLFPDGLVGARFGNKVRSFDFSTGDVVDGESIVPEGDMQGTGSDVVVFEQPGSLTVTEIQVGTIDPYSGPADSIEVFD